MAEGLYGEANRRLQKAITDKNPGGGGLRYEMDGDARRLA